LLKLAIILYRLFELYPGFGSELFISVDTKYLGRLTNNWSKQVHALPRILSIVHRLNNIEARKRKVGSILADLTREVTL
jgi:hypothetical protein